MSIASCETLVLFPHFVSNGGVPLRACGKCDFARSRAAERLCRQMSQEATSLEEGEREEEGLPPSFSVRRPPSLCCCRRGEGNFSSQVLLRSLAPAPTQMKAAVDQDFLSPHVEILVPDSKGIILVVQRMKRNMES